MMPYRYGIPPQEQIDQLSKEQVSNLEKLAAKLKTVPSGQFDMMSYFSMETDDYRGYDTPIDVSPKDYAPECGTVACACGWGPAAGVTPIPDEDTSWNRYARRAFGADPDVGEHYKGTTSIYRYLFDQDQGGTAKQAARRIETLLRRVAR